MNDQQQGPFTLEQMSNLSIMPDTPVWYEGLADWTTADKVEQLSHLVAYAPRVEPAAATEPTPEPPHSTQPPAWTPKATSAQTPHYNYTPSYDAEPAPAKPRKSHTALWVTIAIVSVLAIILAISNPSKDDHCRAIAGVSHSWVEETVEEVGGTGIVGSVIKMGSSPLIRTFVDKVVDVDNYVLFSMGYIDTGTSKTRVSLGIMGHVFTFDKNIINKKLKEALGANLQDLFHFDDFPVFGNDQDDNSTVDPAEQQGTDEDEGSDATVTPEDRAESAFDIPDEVDSLMRKSAKRASKEALKMLEKQVDKWLDDK